MKNFLFISLLFSLISCVSTKSTVQVKFDQKTFFDQKKLWEESNVKNYQYKFLAIGFIPYYGIISVENGSFKDDTPLQEQADISIYSDYSTIDGIYGAIEAIFNFYDNTVQSENKLYYTEIVVEYDKINHIPIEINYKYYSPPELMVDGTFNYKITEFNKMN